MREVQVQMDRSTSSQGQANRSQKLNPRAEKRPAAYRALVVDNDDAVRDTVATILNTFGFRVTKAGDGMTAMSCLATTGFDLVITDLKMPSLNGYRLCAWLKQELSDVIVIIMTACCQAEVAEFMTTGVADRWIFKPFGVNALCAALDELGMPGNCRR